MTANELLMQLQADAIGMPVVRPRVIETTALGAAYAAGLAVGFFSGEEELRERWRAQARWEPACDAAQRERGLEQWRRAVERSLGWVQ
jgi:glycerol kinase